MAVVGLCGVLVLAFGLYRFSQTKEGKVVVGVLGETAKGLNAKGTGELRELGCDQAFVIDMEKVADKLSDLSDAGRSGAKFVRLQVGCVTTGFTAPPSCEQIASTYVKAVGGRATGSFLVTAKGQVDQKPRCQKFYEADGQPRAGISSDE